MHQVCLDMSAHAAHSSIGFNPHYRLSRLPFHLRPKASSRDGSSFYYFLFLPCVDKSAARGENKGETNKKNMNVYIEKNKGKEKVFFLYFLFLFFSFSDHSPCHISIDDCGRWCVLCVSSPCAYLARPFLFFSFFLLLVGNEIFKYNLKKKKTRNKKVGTWTKRRVFCWVVYTCVCLKWGGWWQNKKKS